MSRCADSIAVRTRETSFGALGLVLRPRGHRRMLHRARCGRGSNYVARPAQGADQGTGKLDQVDAGSGGRPAVSLGRFASRANLLRWSRSKLYGRGAVRARHDATTSANEQLSAGGGLYHRNGAGVEGVGGSVRMKGHAAQSGRKDTQRSPAPSRAVDVVNRLMQSCRKGLEHGRIYGPRTLGC
jgi:hypothetical protein